MIGPSGFQQAPRFSAALRATRDAPSTPHQRLFIRTLMREAELDTFTITLMHRRHFEAASLPAPEPGARVEDVLGALTKGQASALAGALQKEVEP